MKPDKVLNLLDRLYKWIEQTESLIKELLDEKKKIHDIYVDLLKEYERRKQNDRN